MQNQENPFPIFIHSNKEEHPEMPGLYRAGSIVYNLDAETAEEVYILQAHAAWKFLQDKGLIPKNHRLTNYGTVEHLPDGTMVIKPPENKL